MRAMRQLVRDAIRSPDQKIRETAVDIIGTTSGYVDQVRLIQRWVQNHITYVRDPVDVELVQTPEYTLQKHAGDCDDQSVLTASLLQAIGHPVQFIAVGLNGAPFSHVLVRTLIGQNWVGVETIQHRPLGWMPVPITSHYIQKV